MFKQTGPNSVVSDEGYSIAFGKELIKYIEGDHRLYIDSAAGVPHLHKVFIEIKSIDRWQRPYENEYLPEAKRLEILERVKKMITFLGYDYQVI